MTRSSDSTSALLVVIAGLAVSVGACGRMGAVPPRGPGASSNAVAAKARFDARRSPTIEVRWREGHTPIVRPLVNGVDVGWFVLDTGASGMTITDGAARAAGLVAVGTTLLQGVTLTTVYAAPSFEIGALTLENVRFASMDMPVTPLAFDEVVVGFCGYDVFAQVVFELDVTGGTAALYDPAAYEMPDVEWQPLYIHRNLPHVRCRFEGDHEGLFLVDAGFDGAVWLFDETVGRHDLLADRPTRQRTIRNLGTTNAVSVGNLAWFELGGHRVDDVECAFSLAPVVLYTGAPDVSGIIGVDLLRHYRLVLDYEGERAAFVAIPNGAGS